MLRQDVIFFNARLDEMVVRENKNYELGDLILRQKYNGEVLFIAAEQSGGNKNIIQIMLNPKLKKRSRMACQ